MTGSRPARRPAAELAADVSESARGVRARGGPACPLRPGTCRCTGCTGRTPGLVHAVPAAQPRWRSTMSTSAPDTGRRTGPAVRRRRLSASPRSSPGAPTSRPRGSTGTGSGGQAGALAGPGVPDRAARHADRAGPRISGPGWRLLAWLIGRSAGDGLAARPARAAAGAARMVVISRSRRLRGTRRTSREMRRA